MVNPEKLATQGTQDEDKQDKNTICVGQWCFEVLPVTIIEILCPLLRKFGNDFDSLFAFEQKYVYIGITDTRKEMKIIAIIYDTCCNLFYFILPVNSEFYTASTNSNED